MMICVQRLLRIVFFLFFGTITLNCSRKEPEKPVEPTFAVEVAEAHLEKDIPIYFDVIGSMVSQQIVNVRPQVGGIIQEAYVQEGAYVKKGDPLYLIDPRPYEAQLAKAKATLVRDKAALAFAKIRIERYAELVEKEYFSKLNYEQYKTDAEGIEGQLLSDEAEIALAELNLEWCRPVSPMDGKISFFILDPGNLVAANDPTALTTIRQISPIDVDININQTIFTKIQKSLLKNPLKFQVFLPQESEEKREGEIYFINNQVDPATGTILLKGLIANEDELFWPGEFVRVRLQLSVRKEAILVPSEAVQMGVKGASIYVYDPETSQVESREVIKGPVIDDKVIIESGLNAKEFVVVKGQMNLRSGSRVFIP